MRNIWTVARRDFRSYFTSPIAYIMIGIFLFVMDFMFYNNLYYFKMQTLQFQGMGGKAVSITDGIIRPLYGNMNVILLFVVPFITMRLIAEERKLQTIQLLLTSPITLTEIVIGKFLSALLLIGIMVLLTCIYPIILLGVGNPDVGPMFTSVLGTFLMAGCYLAIGLFYSSTTENQIVAAVLTFMTCLFFWLISWASQAAGPVWGEVLTYLSLIGHYNNFSQGILDVTDVVYYLSFMGVGLFLTHRVLDSYRWR